MDTRILQISDTVKLTSQCARAFFKNLSRGRGGGLSVPRLVARAFFKNLSRGNPKKGSYYAECVDNRWLLVRKV